MTEPVDIGDRVILASARDRSPDVLGTVIERDPHQDRDVLVRVLHGDGVARWRRRESLRALGHRMAVADLAADLELMGLSTAHLRPTTPTQETDRG
jgi:hypothetical protein